MSSEVNPPPVPGGVPNGELYDEEESSSEEEPEEKVEEKKEKPLTDVLAQIDKEGKEALSSAESKMQEIKDMMLKAQAELEETKKQYNNKQRLAMEREQQLKEAELAKRIKERNDLANKIEQAKIKEEQERFRLVEESRKIKRIEATHAIEQLALKRDELMKLKEKKGNLNQALLSHNLHLTTIEERLKEERKKDVGVLENILKKADRLTAEVEAGTLDDKDKATLAAILFEKKGDAKDSDKVQASLFNQLIMDRRRQRVEREFLDSEQHVSELNQMRAKLEKEHKDLQKKKLEHKEVTKKGIPFVVEMELGNAPPREFLLRNMNIDAVALKDFDDELLPLAQEVEKVRQRLNQDQQSLYKLTVKHSDDMTWYKAKYKAYDGELGLSTYPEESRPLAIWMRKFLLQDLMPVLNQKIKFPVSNDVHKKLLGEFSLDPSMDRAELLAKQKQVEEARKKFQQQLAQERRRKAVLFCSSEIIDEVVQEMARHIHQELGSLFKISHALSLEVLLSAAHDNSVQFAAKKKELGANSASKDILRSALQEIQKERSRKVVELRHARRRFVHRHGLSLSKSVLAYKQRVRQQKKQQEEKATNFLGRMRKKFGGKGAPEQVQEEDKLELETFEDDDEEDREDFDDPFLLKTDTSHGVAGDSQYIINSLDADVYMDFVRMEAAYFTRLHHNARTQAVSSVPVSPWLQQTLPGASASLAGISALAVSPDCKQLAVGDLRGKVVVLDLQKGHVLSVIKVLERSVKSTDSSHRSKSRIKRLAYSMDGQQLTVLDHRSILTVHDLSHRQAFKEAQQASRVSLKLLAGDFGRPKKDNQDKEGKDKESKPDQPGPDQTQMEFIAAQKLKKKREKREALEEARKQANPLDRPCMVDFHPCINLGMRQPSLLIGLESGTMVKWNMWTATSTDFVLAGGLPIKDEPPLPEATKQRLFIVNKPKTLDEEIRREMSSKQTKKEELGFIRREFFEGHVAPISFIRSFYVAIAKKDKYDDRATSEAKVVTITCDRKGSIRIWPYDMDNMSGFGWFTPGKTYRIQTLLDTFCVLPGAAESTTFDTLKMILNRTLNDEERIRDSADQYTSTEAFVAIAKQLERRPRELKSKIIRANREYRVTTATYAPMRPREAELSSLLDERSSVSCGQVHTLTFLHCQKKLPAAPDGKFDILRAAQRGEGFVVLVQHIKRTHERRVAQGTVCDVHMTQDNKALVALIKYDCGFERGWSRKLDGFLGADEEELAGDGVGGGIGIRRLHSRGDDFNEADWTSEEGPGTPFVAMRVVTLSHGQGSSLVWNSQKDLPDTLDQLEISMSPFCVSFPLSPLEIGGKNAKGASSADQLSDVIMTLSPLYDVPWSDYAYVFAPDPEAFGSSPASNPRFALFAISLTTASRVKKVSHPSFKNGSRYSSMCVVEDRLVIMAGKQNDSILIFDMVNNNGRMHNLEFNDFILHSKLLMRWFQCPPEMRFRRGNNRFGLGTTNIVASESKAIGQPREAWADTEQVKKFREERLQKHAVWDKAKGKGQTRDKREVIMEKMEDRLHQRELMRVPNIYANSEPFIQDIVTRLGPTVVDKMQELAAWRANKGQGAALTNFAAQMEIRQQTLSEEDQKIMERLKKKPKLGQRHNSVEPKDDGGDEKDGDQDGDAGEGNEGEEEAGADQGKGKGKGKEADKAAAKDKGIEGKKQNEAPEKPAKAAGKK